MYFCITKPERFIYHAKYTRSLRYCRGSLLKVENKIFSDTIMKILLFCSFFRFTTAIFTNSSFHVWVIRHMHLGKRMCSIHRRMTHRRKRQKKKGEKYLKLGNGWQKRNTKSEKCEAKSGTVLKSKNKAFK